MEAWARAVLSPSLSVTRGAMGFAVHARADIDPGQLLVRVPSALTVTAESALRVPSVAALVSRDTEAHATIAVWLMHAAEVSGGAMSEYARALGEANIDCTLQWSEEELMALQSSRAAATGRRLQGWASDEWATIRSRPAFLDTPLANATFDRFQWALCAVWSRSFQLGCADAECSGAAGTSGGVWRVLAPGADLFNHASDSPGAALEVRADGARPERWHADLASSPAKGYDDTDDDDDGTSAMRDEAEAAWGSAEGSLRDLADSSDAFMLKAARRIPEGAEVTLNYGARSNAELLTTHGFALDGNPAEAVPLSLEPSSADRLGEVKAKLLRAGNVTGPFFLSAHSLTSDSDLLVALRIQMATADELAGKRYADAFRGLPLSERNERRWRAALRERTRAMLNDAEAETTARVDRAILQQMGPSSGGGDVVALRKRAAILTRLGEKRVLHEVLEALERMREAVTAEGGQEGGPGGVAAEGMYR